MFCDYFSLLSLLLMPCDLCIVNFPALEAFFSVTEGRKSFSEHEVETTHNIFTSKYVAFELIKKKHKTKDVA